ncbi:MAG: hypothetical protein AB7P42_19340 [Gammaproteobacteria bacterium]
MNPELLRNLWLEATPQRLVLVPAVLFSAAALVDVLDPTGLAVARMALFGFVLLTLVWGARQAANSVLDEARDRTWDVQRMCALPAWPMTWGKLAGTTVLAWYGGACCLLVYAGSGGFAQGRAAWLTLAFATCAAIIAQSGALLAALVGMHRGRAVQARLGNLLVVALLIWVMPKVTSVSADGDAVRWFGLTFAQLPFAAASAACFAAWALLGASRAMATELQILNRPTAWLGFLFFSALFLTGFLTNSTSPSTALLADVCSALALVAGVAAYAALFAYPSDALKLRRVVQAWRRGDTGRLQEELPLWVIAAALATLAALAAALLGATPTLGLLHVEQSGLSLVALAGMMLRDLLLLTWLVMVSRPGQAEGLGAVYLVLLDGLLPALLPHLGLGALATLLRPNALSAPFMAIALYGLQALAAAVLCWHTYGRIHARLSETPAG